MATVNVLDIFCHWAPRVYGIAALKTSTQPLRILECTLNMPVMTDVPARLQLMDQFPGYRKSITARAKSGSISMRSSAGSVSWYHNTTLALLTHAYLTVTRVQAIERD